MKNEYMQVSAVAAWLGVSKKRVYAMIQEGKLTALRYGPRQTRVARSSVETFLVKARRLHEETLELDSSERRQIALQVFSR